MVIIPLTGKTKTRQTIYKSHIAIRNIPFVLLTNGGGVTEEEKARQISELVGVKVNTNATKKSKILTVYRLTLDKSFCLILPCKI